MKLLVVLASVLAVAFTQGRPGYLGSEPVGYPGLANRFKVDGDTSTTQPVVNRFNGPTDRIPIDAGGDANLINRVNQWPRENRPFWVLNADHIEAQRNTPTRNNQENLSSRSGGQQSSDTIQPDPALYYSFGYDDFGNPVYYRY